MREEYPLLAGNKLFREGEPVYVNRSDELEEYCNIIHRHDFIEIAYVSSGSGLHIVADKQYETSGGDLFIINTDVPHGFFQNTPPGSPLIVYNCVFMPQFLDVSLFNTTQFEGVITSFLFKSLFPEEFTPQPDIRLSGIESMETGSLFEKMHAEYKKQRLGYSDIIRAYLIELIIMIFRYADRQDGPGSGSAASKRELIGKAIEYMRTNYNSEISLSDLAMRSFISRNYFSKVFKQVTGTNVSDFLQHLRMEQACSLLKTTDLKVADIASRVGYNDMKFFYEVFKRIIGKTPNDYRKGST